MRYNLVDQLETEWKDKTPMPLISVWLFGSFEVHRNGNPVDMLRLEKAQALLAYLAAERQAPRRRELLATLLWPDLAQAQGRADLRQLLHRLRSALDDGDEEHPLLRLTSGHIQLDPGPAVWVDVGAFVELLTACKTHRHPSLARCRDCLSKMRAAVSLYRGEFLADWHLPDSAPYQEWVSFRQAELHNMAVTALSFLAWWHEMQCEYEIADGYIQKHLLLEPWSEEAHRRRMCVLAASGDVAAAVMQYDLCRHVLAEQLGIRPSCETEQLCQQIEHNSQADRPDSEPVIRKRLLSLYGAAVSAVVQSRYSVAAEHVEQLTASAQRYQLLDMIWLARSTAGINEFFRGDLQQARWHLEQAVDAGASIHSRQLQSATGADVLALSLHWLSWTLYILGEYKQAQERAAQAAAIAEGHAPTRALLLVLTSLAECCFNRSSPAAASSGDLEKSLPARDAVLPPWRDLLDGLDGHLPGCLNSASVAVDALLPPIPELSLAWILQTLVHVERCVQVEEVHALFVRISRALALVEETGAHVFTAEFHRLQGETLLRMAADCVMPPAVRASLEQQAAISLHVAIDFARAHHLPLWELRATMALCRYYQQSGRHAALPLLTSICSWFPMRDLSPDAIDAWLLLDSLRASSGKVAG